MDDSSDLLTNLIEPKTKPIKKSITTIKLNTTEWKKLNGLKQPKFKKIIFYLLVIAISSFFFYLAYQQLLLLSKPYFKNSKVSQEEMYELLKAAKSRTHIFNDNNAKAKAGRNFISKRKKPKTQVKVEL